MRIGRAVFVGDCHWSLCLEKMDLNIDSNAERIKNAIMIEVTGR